MKQLFYNGKASTIFFNSKDSINTIANWFISRAKDFDNPFNLSEAYGIELVSIDEEKQTFKVMGDEDYIEIILNEIFVTDLTNFN